MALLILTVLPGGIDCLSARRLRVERTGISASWGAPRPRASSLITCLAPTRPGVGRSVAQTRAGAGRSIIGAGGASVDVDAPVTEQAAPP